MTGRKEASNIIPVSPWDAEPELEEFLRLRSLLSTNRSEALRGLRALADHGSRMSMLQIGDSEIYVDDAPKTRLVIRPDYRQAEIWYRRAADMGLIHATHALGGLYRSRKEYKKALAEFYLATSADFAPSMNCLGLMYLKGEGVTCDIQQARYWLERGSRFGHFFSKLNLSRLLLKGRFGISQVPRGLLIWFSAAAMIPFVVFADRHSDLLRH